MNRQIRILTGKVQSGKTTGLFTFINTKKSVDGILAPIVNGKRKLYHISSRTIKIFEMDKSSPETVSVGKYFFLNESFEWANKKIIESFHKSPEWLIIDEIGKLELRRKGLHEAAKKIIEERLTFNGKIILVIRDYLLDEVLKFYNISQDDHQIINIRGF